MDKCDGELGEDRWAALVFWTGRWEREYLCEPAEMTRCKGSPSAGSGQAFDCGCASLSRSTILAQDDSPVFIELK